MQSSARDWLDSFQFNYFVTAVFNCQTSEQSAKSALKKWHSRVDRQLLGPKWSCKATSERTFFVAFEEHPDSNRHYHLMLHSNQPTTFEEVAETTWLKIVPSGALDVQPLATNADKMRTTAYATKGLWQKQSLNNFIVSTEFSNQSIDEDQSQFQRLA